MEQPSTPKILTRTEKIKSAKRATLIFFLAPLAVTIGLWFLLFQILPLQNAGRIIIKVITIIWWAVVLGTVFCLYIYIRAMYSMFFEDPTKEAEKK